MKKLFYVILCILFLSGCGNMNNTPTKKVEELLNKYQSNDIDVVSDLSDVLMNDYNMTDDEKNDYAAFMKKHYQDMVYKIKDETIDGDNATVEVEVTVRNYSSAVNDANEYRSENSAEFNDDNTFSSYRLKKLEEVDDTETYTIYFHLTKVKDEWKVSPISSEDESKLNGLYGVNENISINSTNNEDNSRKNSVNNVTTAEGDNTIGSSDRTDTNETKSDE